MHRLQHKNKMYITNLVIFDGNCQPYCFNNKLKHLGKIGHRLTVGQEVGILRVGVNRIICRETQGRTIDIDHNIIINKNQL